MSVHLINRTKLTDWYSVRMQYTMLYLFHNIMGSEVISSFPLFLRTNK